MIPNFLKLADRSITILGEGGSALANFLSDHFSKLRVIEKADGKPHCQSNVRLKATC